MSDRDKQKKKHNHWPLRVFFMAVVLSALLSFFSSTALEGTGYAVALAVLAAFIALGIVFDMVGVAVTAADPRPFHSMAAHKEKGGKEAIRLLKNANQVSSFCNDVVGDICGIVSGSTAAVIVTQLQRDLSTHSVLLSIGIMAWAFCVDPQDVPPLPLLVVLFGIPAGCIIGTLKVLVDRLKEIGKGEEDAYRNY